MNKFKSFLKYSKLTLLFAFSVFLIMLFTMTIVFVGTNVLTSLNLLNGGDINNFPLFMFSITSIVIGTILAIIFSKTPLKPIRQIIAATDEIANGNYNVELSLKGSDELRQLSNKFNHMVKEIKSVEMLRNDFVNNFSHEFKTPITSIKGFANTLKQDNLSEEQRKEYLNIIIDESNRLATLSNNVLYLSKIENQAIIEKSTYNVSEQIRLVIVLLDNKLNAKQIDLQFNEDEYYINANQEMMKQVWINLFDNAIKFSPECGVIAINIDKLDDSLIIQISNQSKQLSSDTLNHIFDKFYQADKSHYTKGNGLGLSIVKKIIDLHNGTIKVDSTDERITFTITFKLNDN